MARGSVAVASQNGPPRREPVKEDAEDEEEEENEDGPRSYSAIMNISARLTTLQDNLEAERQQRFADISDMMVSIGERISVAEDAAKLKYKGLKGDLTEFQKQTLRMRHERGELAERKTEEIRLVDDRLQGLVEAERSASRVSERRIQAIFETQTSKLAKEVANETKFREGYEGTLRRYLDHDVVNLKERLLEELSNREDMEMRIVKTAQEEIGSLEAELKDEIKAREDTEEAMLRMMEDLVTKMEGDIAGERRDRAKKEEMLMRLLEFTCSKLQVATQSL